MRPPEFETTQKLIARLTRENEGLWRWVTKLHGEKILLEKERDQTWTDRLLRWRDSNTQ